MEKSADRVEFKLQLEYLKFLEVKTDGIKKDELPRLLVDNKHIESIEKYHSLGQYEKVRLLVEILDVNKRTKKSLSDRFQRNGNASVLNGILMQIEIFVAGILKYPSIKEDAELRLSSAILICNTGSMHNLVLLNHSLFCSAGIDGLLMSWKGEFMHQLAKRYLSEDIDVRMMIMDRDPIAHEIHDIGALLYLVKDEWNLYDIKKEVHMRLDKFTPIINSWKEIIAKFIVAQDIVTIIADDIIWRFDVAMKSAPQVTENHKNIDKLSELWRTFFKDGLVISMLCDGNENGITGFHPHYRNVIRAQTLVQLSSLGAIECDGIEEIKGALTAFAEANEDYIYEGKIARPNFDLFDISSSSEELVIANLQEDEVINQLELITSPPALLRFTIDLLLDMRGNATDNIIIAALNRMNGEDVYKVIKIMLERNITITDDIARVALIKSNRYADRIISGMIAKNINITEDMVIIAINQIYDRFVYNFMYTMIERNITITADIARVAFNRLSALDVYNVMHRLLNHRVAITDDVIRIAISNMNENDVCRVISEMIERNITITDDIARFALINVGKQYVCYLISEMAKQNIAITDGMASLVFNGMSEDDVRIVISKMADRGIKITEGIAMVALSKVSAISVCCVMSAVRRGGAKITETIAITAIEKVTKFDLENVMKIIKDSELSMTKDIYHSYIGRSHNAAIVPVLQYSCLVIKDFILDHTTQCVAAFLTSTACLTIASLTLPASTIITIGHCLNVASCITISYVLLSSDRNETAVER